MQLRFLFTTFSAGCGLAGLLFFVPAAHATEPADSNKAKLTISTGIDYSSGDYGQALDTQITYVPVTAKLKYDGWTGKLTVPYISITGPGVVVGGSEGSTVGTAGAKRTESGLGDVIASLGYSAPIASKDTLGNITGKIKFPTADESRNLGTGEFDYTLQAGLTQNINDFYLSGTVGRKFNGSSTQFPLNDVWKYSVGAGYTLTPQTVVGADYDFRQSATAAGDNISEATAFVSHNFNRTWTGQLYTTAGFTNASPNWGIGLQVGYMLDPFDPRLE